MKVNILAYARYLEMGYPPITSLSPAEQIEQSAASRVNDLYRSKIEKKSEAEVAKNFLTSSKEALLNFFA